MANRRNSYSIGVIDRWEKHVRVLNAEIKKLTDENKDLKSCLLFHCNQCGVNVVMAKNQQPTKGQMDALRGKGGDGE